MRTCVLVCALMCMRACARSLSFAIFGARPCVHVFVCAFVHACFCVCKPLVSVCAWFYACLGVNPCVRACARAIVHAPLCAASACVCARARVSLGLALECTCVCPFARARACVRACVLESMRVGMRTRACVRACGYAIVFVAVCAIVPCVACHPERAEALLRELEPFILRWINDAGHRSYYSCGLTMLITVHVMVD